MPKKSDYQAHLNAKAVLKLPELEVVNNPYPNREYTVKFEIPEFTCLCPKTGLPDFATIRIEYVPGARLVELKSLKYYIMGFRNAGVFHESVANRILDDLVKATAPLRARLEADFSVRGGIHTVVETSYP
ncbi:MAG: preQ(1) synthase [candidate division FCPU426 bacterium]